MAYLQSMGASVKRLPTSTTIEADAKQRIAQAAMGLQIPKQTRLASQHTESAPRSEQHQNARGGLASNSVRLYLQLLWEHSGSLAGALADGGAANAATCHFACLNSLARHVRS